MSEINSGEAARWLQFSTEDFAVAKTIIADKHLPPRVACFHCQQSAEKAIKAVLVRFNINFPKTHDLNLLLRLLPETLAIRKSSPDLSALNVFAAEAR